MGWITIGALFFVFWWLFLFVALPLGVRTQEEEGEVTFGTASSAPFKPRLWRAAGITTLITTVVVGLLYVVTTVYGYSFDDIPLFIPIYE